MQERSVTVGQETMKLEQPFFVLATQNPIEQEGTYPLPEAQKDRFLFLVKVAYPSRENERDIIARNLGAAPDQFEGADARPRAVGVEHLVHASQAIARLRSSTGCGIDVGPD